MVGDKLWFQDNSKVVVKQESAGPAGQGNPPPEIGAKLVEQGANPSPEGGAGVRGTGQRTARPQAPPERA